MPQTDNCTRASVTSVNDCITIVITCFNHAHFLAEAIESAINQSYPNCTIIVVDDGSTDATKQVAQQYQSVQYIYQENQGLSAARNTGLRSSQQQYILFLDADDRLSKDCCYHSIYCFDKNSTAAFVYGAHRIIDRNSKVINNYKYRKVDRTSKLEIFRGNFIGMHACVLYRTRDLLSIDGFDTNLNCCEDYDVYIRLTRNHSIGTHPNICADYRYLPDSMSSNKKNMMDTIFFILSREATSNSNKETYKTIQQGKHNWYCYYASEIVSNSTLSRLQKCKHFISLVIHFPIRTLKFTSSYFINKIKKKYL